MGIKNNAAFEDAIRILPERLRQVLCRCSETLQADVLEIRLRAQQPVVLNTAGGTYFLQSSGKATQILSNEALVPLQTEIEAIVQKACGYSVHSHQDDLKNGFVTIGGGHRIGLCGTAVVENSGRICGMRNIYALNLRIAKEITGAANELIKSCFAENKPQNVMILGAPMSGKTTVLKDLCRQISNGCLGRFFSCAVIDERGELSGKRENTDKMQLGSNTDVLFGYKKTEGIALAVRTLSPRMIFCDEIGKKEDTDAILEGMLSGVSFIVTAHANSLEEARRRSGLKSLLEEHVLDYVVILENGTRIGQIKEVIKAGESFENVRPSADFTDRHLNRALFCQAESSAS